MNKYSWWKIGLGQAVGIVFYCLLVAVLFWKGNSWMGAENLYWGPVLMLVLLTVSVLICGLLAFAWPVYLFWEKKKRVEAIRTVVAMTGWLFIFVLLFIFLIILF